MESRIERVIWSEPVGGRDGLHVDKYGSKAGLVKEKSSTAGRLFQEKGNLV